MPNRIIKESICVSDQIDQLTPLEEVTFYRLLVNCDDYGCFDAREKVVMSRLFPLKDFKPADVRKLINKLAAVGLIELYQVDGKPLLKVCKWSDHQRVRISKHKYPWPEVAESCGNSTQVSASFRELPLESESESESISESESKTKRKRFEPPTLSEIAAYCSERTNNIDPEYFYDYQTARKWVLSNGKKAQDWKAVIRTWEKHDKERSKRNPAGDFKQRDYSGVDDELINNLAEEMEEFQKGAG